MKWQKVMAALFWLLALGAYGLYSYQTGLTPLGVLKQLALFLSDSNWGPLLFILVYTLRPVFLFSAAVLSIGAGVIFGPFWGVIYTIIGSNLGASLAYLIGKFFGEGMLPDTGENVLGRYIQRMQEHSFETVFLMRLMFLPYDLVNYLAGFLKISYGPFILATVLGSIPGTISFTLFGASTGLSAEGPAFDWRVLAASVLIFLGSLAVSRWLKNREGVSDE